MSGFIVTNLKTGLSQAQAHERLKSVGPNQIVKRKGYSVGGLFFSQFKSPLIYVLLVAGVVTLALGEYLDALVILVVVLVNTLLGFYQEFKAASSLEALKSYLKPQVRVKRDGQARMISASELVPGDVVLLDAGSSVPADGVVIGSNFLSVNESLLTGESRPIIKSVFAGTKKATDLENIEMPTPQEKLAKRFVFMGTSVGAGIGEMLVLHTGSHTEMGKIATSLSETTDPKTPLQEKLGSLAKTLMVVVVILTMLIFAQGVYLGRPVLEMFELAVAIAVSAIPEGMVVSMTVILSLGMQRILKQESLVRKLLAAETLGSVSVICSDKTGTLTEGKMRVATFTGDKSKIAQVAILANDERDEEGIAMVAWSEKVLRSGVEWTAAGSAEEVRGVFERIDSIPFSSKQKYMASLVKDARANKVFVSGAPEQVLSMCSMNNKKRSEVLKRVSGLAKKGYRVIGFAAGSGGSGKKLTKDRLKGLNWVGLLGFVDPIRMGVKQSLAKAMKAGLDVKIITGDHKDTAIAVMNQLIPGLKLGDGEVITGEELAKLSESDKLSVIKTAKLFARTTPDQKLTIVNVLREQGEVVAMTGDGVNDAPALKAADIGIVVNEATDVSKQTADMVLLNSSFKTIVLAIREGRIVYETMRKVVTFLLADVAQGLILISGSIFLGLPLPITALQILWVNLVEDGLPGLALAFEHTDEGVMSDKPRRRDQPIIDMEIKTLIVIASSVSSLLLLGLYYYLSKAGMELGHMRSMMFVGLSTNSLLYLFSIKSLRKNLWQESLFDNWYLIFSVVLGFVMVAVSLYFGPVSRILELEPLSGLEYLLMLSIGLVSVVAIEFVKFSFRSYKAKQ